MAKKNEMRRGSFSIIGWPFKSCITDGSWMVAPFEVEHTNTGRKAMYIFGADGIAATVYNTNNPSFKIKELAEDTLIKHLEQSPDEFEVGEFRFEFDGQEFHFCKERPRWADYDCGEIEGYFHGNY